MFNRGGIKDRLSGLRRGPRAFTLAELLVTLTLTALLAVSIVSATRALTGTRTNVERRLARSAAARQGLEAIVAALRNVRRDPERERPAIVGRMQDSAEGDRIDLQVVGDMRARQDSPECDQYEVSFYLSQRQGDALPVLLCRRNSGLSEHPGSGGIAGVAAEGIVGLSFQYCFEGRWHDEWPETETGIPEAVRVTVAAMGVQPTTPAAKSLAPVTLSTVVPIRTNPPTEKPQAQQQQGPDAQPGAGGRQGEGGAPGSAPPRGGP